MFDKSYYRSKQVRDGFRSTLRTVGDILAQLKKKIGPLGLSAADVASIQGVASGLSCSLPDLDLLRPGQRFGSGDKDPTANALMTGAKAEDGGGAGTAVRATANGACFFNSLATCAWGGSQSRPSDTNVLALPLRVAVVLTGVKRILDIGSDEADCFRRRDAYDGNTIEAASEQDLDLTFNERTAELYTASVSRALLTLALLPMTREFTEGTYSLAPLAAQALRVNVRIFNPVASIPAPDGTASALGTWFNRNIMSPPVEERMAATTETIMIAASMYNAGKAPTFRTLQELHAECRQKRPDGEEYMALPELRHFVPICPRATPQPEEDSSEGPPSDNPTSSSSGGASHDGPTSAGKGRGKGPPSSSNEDGDGESTPSLSQESDRESSPGDVSPWDSGGHTSGTGRKGHGRSSGVRSRKPLVKKRGRTTKKTAAKRPRRYRGRNGGHDTSPSDSDGDPCVRGRRSPTDPVWGKGERASQYVQSLGEQADALLDLGHGDKLDVTASSLVRGEAHEMGTPKSMLPESLSHPDGCDSTEFDIDFSRHCLLVKHLGTKYLLEGLDSLSHESPHLRKVDMPGDCMALNLGRGPGVLQCLLHFSIEQMDDEELDREKELEGLRDRLLSHLEACQGAMPLQGNSRPHLMCRSHQTVSAPVLRRALEKEGIKYVYLYQWGTKACCDDYKNLDDASAAAHEELAKDKEEAEEEGEEDIVSLPNLFDVAKTYKTGESGIPFVWSYTTGRGNPGQAPRGQRNCASMRTFAQMPGLFESPGGSVQTRGPTVTQWNDITKFTMYTLPDHVLRSGGRFTFSLGKNVGSMKRSIEWIREFWDKMVAEGLATLKRVGTGLRLEARVQGKITAGDRALRRSGDGHHEPL
eukprot:g15360.t1